MAREVLAEAVWQFVITGEVWLNGRRLEAESVNEWANVVKWLYTYIEPPRAQPDVEPEMVVRVVRVDKTQENTAWTSQDRDDEGDATG